SEAVQGNAANFPTDVTNVFNLGSGSQLSPAGSGVIESAILSYLGRAQYVVADKYIFTLTGRRDGSSVFGANHKWAFFPSGAFAWRIGNEGFMQGQSLFSDLKLRVSYGKVGNQAVAQYQSLSRLGVAWYSAGTTEIPALAPGGGMPNPDLKWEEKTELNVGVDASLLNNRVTLSLDAYHAKTTDLLLSVPVPSTTGFSSQLRNIGSLQNRGAELSQHPEHRRQPQQGARPGRPEGDSAGAAHRQLLQPRRDLYRPGGRAARLDLRLPGKRLVAAGRSVLSEESAGLHPGRVQDGRPEYDRHERRRQARPARQRDHGRRPRHPRVRRSQVLRRLEQHLHLRPVLAGPVLQLQLRQQDHQRGQCLRRPRHRAGERAGHGARPVDADAYQHGRPARQRGAPPAALQHAGGGRLVR